MELPSDFTPLKDVVTTEFDTVINWFYDGILFIYAKPNIQHTLEDAKKQITFLAKCTKGNKGKVFLDIRKAPPLSVQARNYYSSDEAREYFKGTCLLIDSPVGRVIGNFYFGFLNKKLNTKMVKTPSEGLKWLNSL